MKKKNGFTLVELLAVIVVLAIIMIIAIPSVLNVMNSARKSSFAIYVKKVVNAVQTQYAYDSNLGDLAGAGLYVYNIATDLNLTSTGSYKGYIVVDARDVDAPHYIVYMYDNNYEIFGWDVSKDNMPEASQVRAFNANDRNTRAATEKTACVDHYKATPTKHYDEETKTWVDDVLETDESKIICYNRDGYVIQNS